VIRDLVWAGAICACWFALGVGAGISWLCVEKESAPAPTREYQNMSFDVPADKMSHIGSFTTDGTTIPSTSPGRSIGYRLTWRGEHHNFPESPENPLMLIELWSKENKMAGEYRVWFEDEQFCWRTPKVARACIVGLAGEQALTRNTPNIGVEGEKARGAWFSIQKSCPAGMYPGREQSGFVMCWYDPEDAKADLDGVGKTLEDLGVSRKGGK
jgi:hypothetical protein